MLTEFSFKNYKSFKDQQTLKIRPITLIIGKNSSGKSAVAKLPVFFDAAFHQTINEPFSISFGEVQFGGEYRDLFYERLPNAVMEFTLKSIQGNQLTIQIVSGFERNSVPEIIFWKLEGVCELVFQPEKGNYVDRLSGTEHKLAFDGFEPKVLTDSESIPVWPFGSVASRTDYIGPFRAYANEMRSFQLHSLRHVPSIGVTGLGAYQILGQESLKSNSTLVESVSNWYKENFDGWGIAVNKDLQPHFTIELTRGDKNFKVNIADVGQGMSQALPLVVSAFLKNESKLTILEQPELHLHPAAHGNLAQLFAESAQLLSKRYLIETHSQNFVLRFRRLVAEGKLSENDFAIYWIDYEGETNTSSIREIKINEFGEVDYWPPNIFSESLDETVAMRTAQKVKGK